MSVNKPLLIRWYRLDVDGQTCERCSLTKNTLDDAINHLKAQLTVAGWDIVVEDVRLSEDQIEKSNLCEINGRSIEDIIDLQVNMNFCSSCSDLTGKSEFCRSVIYKGKSFNEIPYSALIDAILSSAQLKSQGPSFFT
jgi:hypothetical protein